MNQSVLIRLCRFWQKAFVVSTLDFDLFKPTIFEHDLVNEREYEKVNEWS